MSQDEKIKDILNEINHMVDDLGQEKQRMSSSGRITYDKLINFLDKKFDLKNFEIIFSIILKSAIYEIFFYKKTPFKVVIDEHLKITKMFLNDKQKNIINAVLDKIAKSV